MTFSAKNLPRGLKLDAKTGHITGTLKIKGEFNVTLGAKNSLGTTEKKFRIVCGDRLHSHRRWAGTVGIVLRVRSPKKRSRARRMRW